MKLSRFGALLVAVAALVFGPVTSATLTTAAAVNRTAEPCGTPSVSRIGDIGGIQAPRPTRESAVSTCSSTETPLAGGTPPSSPYDSSASPPLINHYGPMMGTSSPVVITPIYWYATGYSFPVLYKTLAERFLRDVAADDGLTTNVFSNLEQYTQASDAATYDITDGTAIDDTDAYPSSENCAPDAGEVYSDGSKYTACVTDGQIRTELAKILSTDQLATDLNHLYLVFLPKGVESCETTDDNAVNDDCTVSAEGGSFCGYHSYLSTVSDGIYADLPYPVIDNPVQPDYPYSGETCGSDGGSLADGFSVGNQSPNNGLDADTVISVASHEISEAITDPLQSAWYDNAGNEVADDCAYIYGDTTTFGGVPGAEYNQTINGDHYFIQEQFSNHNYFLNPTDSCTQGLAWSTHTVTFEANSGSGTMANESDDAPTPLTTNAFTRTGFRFSGWNTSPSGNGTSYPDAVTYPFGADATLYAQWVAITPIAPTISWPTPGTIGYGTPLSATQLDASASVAGSFSYSPPAGTVLGTGTSTLIVVFNPTDSIDYLPATTTVPVTVNPAPLQIAASSTTMTFGGAPPSVAPSLSGFVDGEGPASLTSQPSCSTTITRSTPSGTYSDANSCTGAVDANYAITYLPANAIITASIIRVASTALTVTHGTSTAASLKCSRGFCRGTVLIIQDRVTEVKKGKTLVRVTKHVVLGHKTFAIKMGKTTTENITLNAAGKAALEKASKTHALSVQLQVVLIGTGPSWITVKVT